MIKSRIGCALLLSLLAAPALASPVVMSGGYWALQFGDTEVVCGSGCASDQQQYAIWNQYNLEGTSGFNRSAQSGAAHASMAVHGFGTASESDTSYDYQLTVSRALFASVDSRALPSTYAFSRANIGGWFGFELSETVRYTGDSFGSITNGMILGPGSYGSFFGSAFGNLSTATMHAGQYGFAWDVDTFRFGVESIAVPEPGTLALLGAGLLAIGLANRRRKVRT